MSRVAIAFCLLYIGAGALGLSMLWAHESTAGPASIAPAVAPASVSSSQAVIAMAVHPQCPCTVAGLETLKQVWSQRPVGSQVQLRVYLDIPSDTSADFANGKTAEIARSIPGVHVILDPDGRVGSGLGAVTSGHVVAYDTGGRLRFSGGLTTSRSHGGSSVGVDVLTKLLNENTQATAPRVTHGAESTPVYGCPLSGTDMVTTQGLQ